MNKIPNISITFEIDEKSEDILISSGPDNIIDWDISGKIDIRINGKLMFKIKQLNENAKDSISKDYIDNFPIIEWFIVLLDTAFKLRENNANALLPFESLIFSLKFKREGNLVFVTFIIKDVDPFVKSRWGVDFESNIVDEVIPYDEFLKEVINVTNLFINKIIDIAPQLKDSKLMTGFIESFEIIKNIDLE